MIVCDSKVFCCYVAYPFYSEKEEVVKLHLYNYFR